MLKDILDEKLIVLVLASNERRQFETLSLMYYVRSYSGKSLHHTLPPIVNSRNLKMVGGGGIEQC